MYKHKSFSRNSHKFLAIRYMCCLGISFSPFCLLTAVHMHTHSPGGDTIRQIQVQSGAHVELHRGTQPSQDEKLFNIRGNTQEIQMAQQLIREKYENMPGGGGGGGPQFGPGYVGNGVYYSLVYCFSWVYYLLDCHTCHIFNGK